MEESNLRRPLDLGPASWHVHIRTISLNWANQEVPCEQLYPYSNRDEAAAASQEFAAEARNRSRTMLHMQCLAPGVMPQLARADAWYLHTCINHSTGLLAVGGVLPQQQALHPYDSQEQVMQAHRHLLRFLDGVDATLVYLAFVPPAGRGEAIVVKPRTF